MSDDEHEIEVRHAVHFISMLAAFWGALEIFNLVPVGQIISCLLVLGCLTPYGLFFVSRRNHVDYRAIVAGVAVVALFVLDRGYQIQIHDSLAFHTPKVLMQATQNNMAVHTGATYHFSSVIAFADNISMLFMIASKSERALIIFNNLCLFFVLYQTMLLVKARTAFNVLLVLLVFACLPSFTLEAFIFKPNVLAPAAVSLSALTFANAISRDQGKLDWRYFGLAAACAFLFLIKITAFLAILPLIIAFTIWCLWVRRDELMSQLLPVGLAAGIGLVVIAPYLLRQYAVHGISLVDSGSSGWTLIPPKIECAFQYWPQHVMSMLDGVLERLGISIDGTVTSKSCAPRGVDYSNVNFLWYGRDFGLWLLAAYLLLRKPQDSAQKAPIVLLGIAILVPAFHATVYVNSIFNTRLIDFALIAFALIILRSCQVTSIEARHVLFIMLAGFVLSASHMTSGNRMNGITRFNAQVAGLEGASLSNHQSVAVFRAAPGSQLMRTSFGMLSIFREVDFNPGRIKFFYFDRLADLDGNAYALVCASSQYKKSRWPADLKQDLRPKRNTCRLLSPDEVLGRS